MSARQESPRRRRERLDACFVAGRKPGPLGLTQDQLIARYWGNVAS